MEPIVIFIILVVVSLLRSGGKKQQQQKGVPRPRPKRPILEFPDFTPEKRVVPERKPAQKEVYREEAGYQQVGKASRTGRDEDFGEVIKLEEDTGTSLGFNFFASRDDLARGIIMAEVLGPPVSRKKRRRI